MAGIYNPGEYTSPRPLHQAQAGIIRTAAGEPIPFGRVVYDDGSKAYLASPADGRFSGMSVRRSPGSECEILPGGLVESDDWSTSCDAPELQPNRAYFLSNNGQISLIPPEEGFIIRVGRAISKNTLNVTFDLKVI